MSTKIKTTSIRAKQNNTTKTTPSTHCPECGEPLLVTESGRVAECPGCGYTEA